MASRLRRAATFLTDPRSQAERSYLPLSWDQYLSYFKFNGHSYPLGGMSMPHEREEPPEQSFEGFSTFGFRSNSVIFACLMVRMLVFSEARFQFRQIRGGTPGDLFGTQELVPLEQPWANATTGDLLARAIQDVDLAGNFYALREGTAIRRLRPDWVSIVLGSQRSADDPALALDCEVVGYMYKPGGSRSEEEPVPLLPEDVAHFAPLPDPTARFRGISWLTPVIREVMADSAAVSHKLRFFENGATVNLAFSLDPAITKEQFDTWVELFRSQHEGPANAYKTLFLGGGAQPIPVGSNFQQMDFKVVQGHGETRIAAAAGVPPIIVGLSEGLESATYSNYALARRRFADATLRPLWRNICGSLAHLVNVPSGAELWYDDRDIPFLQDDMRDKADIQATQASAMKTLIDAGFDPPTVVEAVTSNDLSRLNHSGLVSVQLRPPGSEEGEPSSNGVPVLAETE